MSELKGHGSDAPNTEGTRRLDDWQRIDAEWSQRAAEQRRWDATHDPSEEFEKAARPLGPDWGRDRPATRTIGSDDRAEMVELWGEAQVAKLEASGRLAVIQHDRPGHHRDQVHDHTGDQGRGQGDGLDAEHGGDQAGPATFQEADDAAETARGADTTVDPVKHTRDRRADQDTPAETAEHAEHDTRDGERSDRSAQRRRAEQYESRTTRVVERDEGTTPDAAADRSVAPSHRHQQAQRPQQVWVDGLLLIADPTETSPDSPANPEEFGSEVDAGVEQPYARPELPAWARQDHHTPRKVEQYPADHQRSAAGRTDAAPESFKAPEAPDTNVRFDHSDRASNTDPSAELRGEALEEALEQLAADGDRSVLVFNRDGEHIATEHRGPDAYATVARHYLQEAGEILSAARYEEDPFVKGGVKMLIEGDDARSMVGSRYLGEGGDDPSIARALATVLPVGYSVTIQQSAYEPAIVVDGRRTLR